MAEPGSILAGDAEAERKARALERQRRRRSRLTEEDRARMAAAKRLQRARETDEDRARHAEAQRLRRARQDEETKAALREIHRQRKAARRLEEREEEAAARRAAGRMRKAAQREKETEEAKAARRAADRRRKAAQRAQRRVAETLWHSADEQLSCDVVVRDDAFGAVCGVCDRLWFDGDAADAATPTLERDSVELASDGARSGDAVKAYGMCPTCRLTFGDDSLPLPATDAGTPYESTAPSLTQLNK